MMSDIKVGTIAYHKISEEPMFVLELSKGMVPSQLSGVSAKVRWATSGDHGKIHNTDFFAVEELETLESAQTRRLSEIEELRARFEAQKPKGTDSPSTEDKLGLLN